MNIYTYMHMHTQHVYMHIICIYNIYTLHHIKQQKKKAGGQGRRRVYRYGVQMACVAAGQSHSP